MICYLIASLESATKGQNGNGSNLIQDIVCKKAKRKRKQNG